MMRAQALRNWVTPAVPDRHDRDLLPRWRGRSHQLALLLSVPAGILLVLHANSLNAKIASAIYAVTVVGLFCTSSLYNRLLGTVRFREWMRWVDHATIYALIAGSYTPTCLVTLPRRTGIPLLICVWTGAIVGALSKFLLKQKFRIVGGTLYTLVGCAVVFALPQLRRYAPTPAFVLYLLGGAFYAYGGLTLYRRSPDPHPELFGYHEVWHLFVIVGASAHFLGNWLSV